MPVTQAQLSRVKDHVNSVTFDFDRIIFPYIAHMCVMCQFAIPSNSGNDREGKTSTRRIVQNSTGLGYREYKPVNLRAAVSSVYSKPQMRTFQRPWKTC